MSERGIELRPDADDPKRVKLTAGLPEGISRAEISYRGNGGLRGTREVRRSVAEFAQLRTSSGGYDDYLRAAEQLTLRQAQQYIDRALQRIEQQDNEIRRRRAAVDLTCPWCARERTYLGVHGFMTGVAGILTERPAEWGQELLHQHAYRCDGCGSMQYFADGFLAHPLPGRSGMADEPADLHPDA
ncbi:hypothetical protein [Nocardia sp. NPDC024068]|uniref:hypothetical protein n=1 Tax=Nocardia sp. NPDC024068 TaxID=3157197 RepID=UPI0033FF8DCD